MKRTFIAVRSEAGKLLSESVDDIKADLSREKIRWEDLSRIHITLAFIGETSEDTIKDICGMLENICSKTGSFSFIASGTGLFRNIRDPRVLWAGIEDYQSLSALHDSISEGLRSLGIKVEERPFVPHITIARIKSIVNRNALEAVLEKYKDVRFQKSDVREVIYYESILRPEGSLYLPIRKFKLKD